MTERDQEGKADKPNWRLIFHRETVLAAVMFVALVSYVGTLVADALTEAFPWDYWMAALVAFSCVAAIVALLSLIGGGSTHFELAVSYGFFLGFIWVVMSAYPDYSNRKSVFEVAVAGQEVAMALDRYRERERTVLPDFDHLGVTMPPGKVANVRIESPDRITIALAMRRLPGAQVVLVAVTKEGKRSWQCVGRNIKAASLPRVCNEEVKASS